MNPQELLRQANIALQKAVDEKNRKKLDAVRTYIVSQVVKELTQAIKPALESVVRDNAALARAAINQMKEAKTPDIHVSVPPINVPTPQIHVDLSSIRIPEPRIDISPILRPEVHFPGEMSIKDGWVNMMMNGKPVTFNNPLAVELRDSKGNPVNLFENLKSIVGGSSSHGGGGTVNIGGATATVGVVTINPDGLPTYTVSASGSGGGSTVSLVNTDGLYYNSDNPLPVTGSFSASPAPQVSGAADSVNVMMYGGNATTTGLNETTAGTFRMVQMTDSISSVNVVNANSIDVKQASGASDSVNLVTINGSAPATGLNETNSGVLRTVMMTDSINSVNNVQWGGAAVATGLNETNTGVIRTVVMTDSITSVNNMQWGGSNVTTGLNETTLGTIRTVQMTDSISSVYVTGYAGTTGATIVDSSGVAYSGSNPFPVSASLSASAVQVSDGQASTVTSHQFNTDFRDLDVYIGGSFTSSAATLVDSSGVAYSGSNPLPVSASLSASAVQVSDGQASTISSHQFNTDFRALDVYIGGAFSTVGVSLVDSSGVGYNTSNPVPTTMVTTLDKSNDTISNYQASGFADSVNLIQINGNTPATGLNETTSGVIRVVMMTDAITSVNVVSGSLGTTAAVLTRQSNPTAIAADYVPLGADDLGRQLTRPIQVRDLIATAYTTVSNGTETTILTAGAATFLDCIWMMFANTSSAAQQIDVRCTSGGNIVHTAYIPAQSTVGWAPPVPWPQDATGNAWTVDGADVTNSNVIVTSLFSKEV